MLFFFFKQKTAYEMRISDWSSDVCSSDLEGCGARRLSLLCRCDAQPGERAQGDRGRAARRAGEGRAAIALSADRRCHERTDFGVRGADPLASCDRGHDQPVEIHPHRRGRSEEHTSELQSLMRISYAVFCLKTQ